MKYHHERWDGKGYPEGLAGENIPFLGRLLGVSDFLDALISDRSYRQGLPLEEALQMVKDLEGQAFDPVVVKGAGLCDWAGFGVSHLVEFHDGVLLVWCPHDGAIAVRPATQE